LQFGEPFIAEPQQI